MLCFKDMTFCSKSHECKRVWCPLNVMGEIYYEKNTLPVCYADYHDGCGRYTTETPLRTKYPFIDMIPGDRILYQEKDGFDLNVVKNAFYRYKKKLFYPFALRTFRNANGKVLAFYCINHKG